jgi:Zn-dependent M28 family amino/carboxypeptidase
MHRSNRALGTFAVVAALAGAGSAQAATQTDTQKLQAATKVGTDTSGIRQHLKALQAIANLPQSAGTRSTGTFGHERSADYVIGKLPSSYWKVTSQPFLADVFHEDAPPQLSAAPNAPAWTANQDYATMEFSGTGTVNDLPVVVIGYVPPTNKASASSAGCTDAQFPAGATSLDGKVAVLQRGTCDFGLKAQNAQNHGADAVLIFNEGTIGDPDRSGLINGTVGGYGITIPVLEGTYDVGKFFVTNPGATVDLAAFGRTETLPTRNVIAESIGGRSDRVVLSGAHLDSVPEGPGINDDGSGSATQLEIARQMASLNVPLRNKVRFLWFSGEEQGLYGSIYYADHLTKAERSNTLAMLDFDMLASPNYALQIYDGDGSEFATAGPNGSGVIEKVFQGFFDARPAITERIEFDGRSDYDEFTQLGIPAGGIATGAEVHKTVQEQGWWGGTVSPGLTGQFDPCYHLACDSYPSNINNTALNVMSDAVAHSVLTFAQTTSSTNGTNKGSTSSTKDYEWKGDHRVK